jgi:SAM-dependent methyltransferase
MRKNDLEQKTWLYHLLNMPVLYKFSQKAFGKYRLYRKITKDYINAKDGDLILDIGCGTADIVKFLPKGIQYVGFDVNAKYIIYARNKYKDKAKLYNMRVSETNASEFGKFDFIISIGVIHHLSDSEAIDLFQLGYNLLKPGGVIITLDPAFCDADNSIAKFVTRMDRGKNVRIPEQYKSIANRVFQNAEIIIRNDLIFVPQSNCILLCKK